jgi:cytochrome c peroxidase
VSRKAAVAAALLLLAAGRQAHGAWRWDLPPGFPAPRVPASNPMTRAKVELGRRLFADARLSGNGTLACSGCHDPARDFTDGRARPRGAEGDEHPRSAPSLVNAAYARTLGWDDPGTARLEDQARVPLFNEHPIEMGLAGREEQVLERLSADPATARLFRRAFPGERESVTVENVARALASYERTLIAAGSPYDRWAYLADADALSPEARAGAALFFSSRLACSRCHAGFTLSGPVDYAGAELAESRFHNTGLYDEDGSGRYPEPNTGVHRFTGRASDMGLFRAPSLRNVARTAPYMHDGSIATLEQVVEHYAAGGRAGASPLRDPLITGFEISEREKRELVRFLESLSGER